MYIFSSFLHTKRCPHLLFIPFRFFLLALTLLLPPLQLLLPSWDILLIGDLPKPHHLVHIGDNPCFPQSRITMFIFPWKQPSPLLVVLGRSLDITPMSNQLCRAFLNLVSAFVAFKNQVFISRKSSRVVKRRCVFAAPTNIPGHEIGTLAEVTAAGVVVAVGANDVIECSG